MVTICAGPKMMVESVLPLACDEAELLFHRLRWLSRARDTDVGSPSIWQKDHFELTITECQDTTCGWKVDGAQCLDSKQWVRKWLFCDPIICARWTGSAFNTLWQKWRPWTAKGAHQVESLRGRNHRVYFWVLSRGFPSCLRRISRGFPSCLRRISSFTRNRSQANPRLSEADTPPAPEAQAKPKAAPKTKQARKKKSGCGTGSLFFDSSALIGVQPSVTRKRVEAKNYTDTIQANGGGD